MCASEVSDICLAVLRWPATATVANSALCLSTGWSKRFSTARLSTASLVFGQMATPEVRSWCADQAGRSHNALGQACRLQMWVLGSNTHLCCTTKICGDPQGSALFAGAWGGAQGISASSPRTTITATRSGAGSRWRAERPSARRCVKYLPSNLGSRYPPCSFLSGNVWLCLPCAAAVAIKQCAQTICRKTVMRLLCPTVSSAVLTRQTCHALTILGHVREAFLFGCAGSDGCIQQAEQVAGVHASVGKRKLHCDNTRAVVLCPRHLIPAVQQVSWVYMFTSRRGWCFVLIIPLRECNKRVVST